MSRFLERAKELRNDPDFHYNCAQAVVIPFAEALGYDTQLGLRVGEHFGAGMRMGATCGAVTGGLMALGLYGVKDANVCLAFEQRVKANHKNHLDCGALLKTYFEEQPGAEKKVHCDDMVYECVETVEAILGEQGLL